MSRWYVELNGALICTWSAAFSRQRLWWTPDWEQVHFSFPGIVLRIK